jgi:hypothetical protein
MENKLKKLKYLIILLFISSCSFSNSSKDKILGDWQRSYQVPYTDQVLIEKYIFNEDNTFIYEVRNNQAIRISKSGIYDLEELLILSYSHPTDEGGIQRSEEYKYRIDDGIFNKYLEIYTDKGDVLKYTNESLIIETWNNTIDFLNKFGGLLSVIFFLIGIPFAILSPNITSRYNSRRARKSIKYSKKRLESLKQELEYVRQMQLNNKSNLYLNIFLNIMRIILYEIIYTAMSVFISSISFGGLGTINLILLIIFLIPQYRLTINTIALIQNSLNYTQFKENIEAEISKAESSIIQMENQKDK